MPGYQIDLRRPTGSGISAPLLTGVVDSVGQQSQKTGPLDGLDNPGLLLPRSSSAPRCVDLPDGIQEARQHVEALVVDLLELELGGEFFATGPSDGA